MKVATLRDTPNVPMDGADRIEGRAGPVSRKTTGWHADDCDQTLVVTSGSGMVATEHEPREIKFGDVVHIRAGERHWHGAEADTTTGHITITKAGGQATWG